MKRNHMAALLLIMAAVFFLCPKPALAQSDPIKVINNLSDLIFEMIRSIGMILLAFGIVQVGLAMKSHDASQRANGFMTLAGGIVITFTKEILEFILK